MKAAVIRSISTNVPLRRATFSAVLPTRVCNLKSPVSREQGRPRQNMPFKRCGVTVITQDRLSPTVVWRRQNWRKPAEFAQVLFELCRHWEFNMSNPAIADPQLPFTPRSESESICSYCSLTIRADKYLPLQEAEDIHADVCLSKPGSPVRYMLL